MNCDQLFKGLDQAVIFDLYKRMQRIRLAEEEVRGQERCHLTARQAGIIAREAEVKKLNVFHFSGRHTFRTEQIIQEAEEAFRGKL